MIDFSWQTNGGVLIDSTGDIAFTSTDWECLTDMVVTRVKTTLNGWKLYSIGANLQQLVGSSSTKNTISNIESQIQQQVTLALTHNFLPQGSFTVSTIPLGNIIKVYVFIKNTLLASTTVTL